MPTLAGKKRFESKLSLDEGAIFAHRYRVVGCIAMGGMGAVYEVMHIETERHHALKIMLPDIVQSAPMRERFRRETRVTARLKSDFIVEVSDAGIDEQTDMPFLIMELLRGEDMGEHLQRVGRLEPGEVVNLIHQAALGIDKAHRACIVHRDLKPANLFLAERDDGPPRIKVLDFGIAKLVADGTAACDATQGAIGTPLYMAPEQFDARETVSPATDVYALAMIAFTFLVGETYWFEELKVHGQNVIALACAMQERPCAPASARAMRLGVALPPAFDAWFARATALASADRFQTATSAALALAEALDAPSPLRDIPSAPTCTPTAQGTQIPLETALAAATTLERTHATPSRGRGKIITVTAMITVLVATGLSLIRASSPKSSAAEPATPSSASVAAPTAPPTVGAASPADPLSKPLPPTAAIPGVPPAMKTPLTPGNHWTQPGQAQWRGGARSTGSAPTRPTPGRPAPGSAVAAPGPTASGDPPMPSHTRR
jgi:serine/threonine-protein kinase